MVFGDISKAFDKVWHAGLLFKLKNMGITEELLVWISNYLCDRKQRVVLQGESSRWADINADINLKVSSLDHFCFWFTLMIWKRA